MHVHRVLVAAALSGALGVSAGAHQSVTKTGDVKTANATITQIDSTGRFITFKSDDGTEDTVWAGPDVKRFDELKVGDKVAMRYYETAFFNIRKPNDPPLSMTGTGEAVVTGTAGQLPGGTAARQIAKTVKVKSVDPMAGVITVTTDDGRVITRKVDDKTKLAGVNPGDQIDVVYTEAVLVTVERPM